MPGRHYVNTVTLRVKFGSKSTRSTWQCSVVELSERYSSLPSWTRTQIDDVSRTVLLRGICDDYTRAEQVQYPTGVMKQEGLDLKLNVDRFRQAPPLLSMRREPLKNWEVRERQKHD